MKKSLFLVVGFLVLTSFVLGALEINTTEIQNSVTESVQEVYENSTEKVANEALNIDYNIPENLQFIGGVTTLTGLIIYLCFFVILWMIIKIIIGFIIENNMVRSLLSLAITLLATLNGSIQKAISIFIGIDLLSFNYQNLSWRIIGTIFLSFIVLGIFRRLIKKFDDRIKEFRNKIKVKISKFTTEKLKFNNKLKEIENS